MNIIEEATLGTTLLFAWMAAIWGAGCLLMRYFETNPNSFLERVVRAISDTIKAAWRILARAAGNVRH